MQSGLLKTYRSNLQSRGHWAWILSLMLFGFYVLIYFSSVFDPVASKLGLGSRWTLYGLMYTIAVAGGGIFFLRKHGNSRYQRNRTLSVIFFQTIFAFSIPLFMELFEQKGFMFSIFWPLKIDYFSPAYILEYPLPAILFAFWGSLILVPVLAFFFGKRWYCSWVCGCGGLAETAGDSFRGKTDLK